MGDTVSSFAMGPACPKGNTVYITREKNRKLHTDGYGERGSRTRDLIQVLRRANVSCWLSTSNRAGLAGHAPATPWGGHARIGGHENDRGRKCLERLMLHICSHSGVFPSGLRDNDYKVLTLKISGTRATVF